MPDKDSGRKAVRAGVGYTIGNLLIKGLAFLSIPIFSNLLSTADYGVFNTYSAYMSLFTVVISLGLPSSIRTAHYDFGERSKEYISCGALLIVMNLALFLALGALCRQALEVYGGLRRSLVFLAVLSSFGSALLSYYNSHLSMEYRSREFLAISFFYSFSSIALSILLICTHRGEAGYYWRALGNTLPMLLVAAYVLFRLWRRERPRVRREYARYGLRFGLPLIPHDLSRIVLSQFDRIMIAQSVGDAQAGLFSFACNLGLPNRGADHVDRHGLVPLAVRAAARRRLCTHPQAGVRHRDADVGGGERADADFARADPAAVRARVLGEPVCRGADRAVDVLRVSVHTARGRGVLPEKDPVHRGGHDGGGSAQRGAQRAVHPPVRVCGGGVYDRGQLRAVLPVSHAALPQAVWPVGGGRAEDCSR